MIVCFKIAPIFSKRQILVPNTMDVLSPMWGPMGQPAKPFIASYSVFGIKINHFGKKFFDTFKSPRASSIQLSIFMVPTFPKFTSAIFLWNLPFYSYYARTWGNYLIFTHISKFHPINLIGNDIHYFKWKLKT